VNCPHTVSLGVYLLGALEPAERYEFEAHLATCDTCRRELVRLSPLPGLLNQISPEDFEDEVPPTAVEQVHPNVVPVPAFRSHSLPPEPRTMLDTPMPDTPLSDTRMPDTPKRPARRYAQLAAAAAVVVLLTIGGIFGWQAMRHPSDEDQLPGVTWSATGANGVSGDARLIDHEWGTEIQVKMRELPPGKTCYLVVYDHYGRFEVTGWWGTDHHPEQEIPASTSIDRSKIERIEFKLDEATTVLTIEAPAG
jgi:hypothetical protein